MSNHVFRDFCACLDKAADAERLHDLKAMRLYLKKAESYPIVVNFQKWLLEYAKNIFALLYGRDADKAAAIQELLRLRREALYKPETLEEYQNSIYRFVKDSYVRLLMSVLSENYRKMNDLQEYEELFLELLEIMEKERWELLRDKDYYSCIHEIAADYYAQMGRPALAQGYYQKVWDKYKDSEFISGYCFSALCSYLKNLIIQGKIDESFEIAGYLSDRLFEEKVDGIDETKMETVIHKFLVQMVSLLTYTNHAQKSMEILDSMLDAKIFQSREWSGITLDAYLFYLNELHEKKQTCSLKRQWMIRNYLKKYEKKENLTEKPAWKRLEYYEAWYYMLRLRKSRKAVAYLDKSRELLQEGQFDERDRMPFLAGVQFVIQEYMDMGNHGKAYDCAEHFMKKNMEFYATAEFYADNENMEKYLEVCDLGFQYTYQAVSDIASADKKFEYSLNYKKILSSVIRLRNRIHASGEDEMGRREKKTSALQYFTVQMLADLLPDNTAVLDFLYIEPEIYQAKKRIRANADRAYGLDIFAAVKKDGQCVVKYKRMPEANRINGQIENLIAKMKSGIGKVKKLSADVYHELILEFVPVLKDIRHLWICPDGILCNFSFDTFLELADNGLDICDVTYWQSLRDIFEVWQTDEAALGYCIIGDPRFELKHTGGGAPDDEAKRWALTQLVPLPYSGYEAKKLAMSVNGECFVSEKATKFVLKHGYRQIHIATHGLNQGGAKKPWYDSMLAFSGSQDYLRSGKNMEGYGNGFLTAEEISKMNLTGTELVVLSACGSGQSIFSVHQQQTGLHVAFGVVGVKYIVSALWEVDDFTTAALMDFFYGNLKKGLPAEAALSRAKLQLKNLTAAEVAALIRRDKDIMPNSYDELLSKFEEMPAEYRCFSSMRYWGSFVCSRAMY